eukprot:scaffold19791_cov65-Phaeocystis_antarctica.AAC.1
MACAPGPARPMRSPRIGTTMRSFRPAMPSAAVAASAMTSGGSTAVATARSARALRLLLWCSDSVQAGARGEVARLGPTCMSLQPVSHASCNGNSIERTHAQGSEPGRQHSAQSLVTLKFD